MRVEPLALTAFSILVTLLVLAPYTGAHAYLENSTPAPGGDIPEDTSVLALRFSEQIDPAHVHTRLENATGATLETENHVPSSRPAELRVLTDPLPADTYTLSWRVLSVDGHMEAGAMGFTVAGEGEAGGLVDRSGEPPSLMDGLDGVARALFLSGVLVAVGLPLFVAEVARLKTIPRRIPGSVAALLVGSLVGLSTRWGVLANALDAGWVGALGTRAGGYLVVEGLLVSVALAFVVTAWARGVETRSMMLYVAVLPAGLAVIVHSMGGHGVLAFASREAVAGHVAGTLHILITGVWAGGILGFLLLRGEDEQATGEMVARFFPVGVVSVGVLGVTGVYQAYVHLPRLADVWSSPYGWILLAKSGLLLGLVGAGWVHKRWSGPMVREGGDRLGFFRGLVRAELFVLVLVVGLAGVLAATPLPDGPLGEGTGPVAVFEAEDTTQDFEVRLVFDVDTVRVGMEHAVTLELHPRTSLGTEDVRVNLTARPPSGGDAWVDVQREGDGIWRGEGVVFEEEGAWEVTARLGTPAGEQTALFEVPVFPQQAEA